MAYIKQYGSVILDRRDAWGGDTWASGGARWAFFAIFIVLILIVIFGTLRVNKKRSRQGVQPLYGTRWMTPPSYRQSQTQYDQPDNVRDPDLPSAYVPTYTAEANEYDMGYYDQSGKFHANPNAKAASMAPPPSAHQRQTSVHGDAIPISSTVPAGVLTDEDADISRPTGPPPGMDIVGSESNESLGDFYRPPVHTVTGSFIPPSGPPPGHSELREGSSSSSNIEASTINISDGINTKGSGKD
ncbi:hypothetical protein G9P44_004029 [Scheffersomyces stipitis]|nr:hypothetical protein G9P44_004029 [Scheffersomyces stipitis]